MRNATSNSDGGPRLSIPAAVALGVGAMMGSGIFTLLGQAAATSGPLIPLAFLVAAFAASFSVYSYARLGGVFPSSGGAANFLRVSFGTGLFSGAVNVFQYVAYLVATALYAAGFAEYAAVMIGSDFPSWGTPVVGALVVIVFSLVNLLGTAFTARAELITVVVTVAILVLLAFVGALKADPGVLVADALPSVGGVLTGAGLLYVNYQGFGVVTNAAPNMSDPQKQLPRAMFTALTLVAVLYLVISTVTVLVLPVSDIERDAGHVLAALAQSSAGQIGFTIVALAALLASAAAVNATIFAASNIAKDVAANGQLPRRLSLNALPGVPSALFLSMLLVVALVVAFPLASIGQMTSLAFLLVYAAVSVGHLRVRDRTGARRWPLLMAILLNAVLFVMLLGDAILHGPVTTWLALLILVAASFTFQWGYRRSVSRN